MARVSRAQLLLIVAALLGLLALGPSAATAAPAVAWQPTTSSPQPLESKGAWDSALYALCGEPDQALERVASQLLEQRLAGALPTDPDEIDQITRAAGSPHVWPAAWAVSGVPDNGELGARLSAWVRRGAPRIVPRCGAVRVQAADGTWAAAAVTVDAVADLAPLPRRVRSGQWLALDGWLRVPADGVHVVLLGPRGRPERVLSSLSEGRIRSRFALGEPGSWLIQVVAHMGAGPLPVLEARIFVDAAPPQLLDSELAPGQGIEDSDPARALYRMLNAARLGEGLPALVRDPELDALAAEHAATMARLGRLGHELGRGTADLRVADAGLGRSRVGENVARASSVVRAHRALWASPSHRENMLLEGYGRVGVAVKADGRGTLWAAQLFTD